MDLTEMSVIEELTQFIEKDLEISCEHDNEEVSRMETTSTDESLDIYDCEDSDDKYCRPIEEMLNISKKLEYSQELVFPCTMNSQNVNEILLQTYIAKVILQDDSTNFKTSNSSDQEDFGFGDMHSDISIENGPPPIDHEDLDFPKSKSSYQDCLRDSNLLPEAFNNLVHKLKDIAQKVDELLEAMDSRPHWNRMVGKSNSPWKQNNPNMDLDSCHITDKKPKILKQWTETRSKFTRLSAFLKTFLYPCTFSSELLECLEDVKSTILRCVDFNKVQDCSNLTENIKSTFDADSDDRYMLNLERRILTIEVTLKNITFEIDRLYDEYQKERKF